MYSKKRVTRNGGCVYNLCSMRSFVEISSSVDISKISSSEVSLLIEFQLTFTYSKLRCNEFVTIRRYSTEKGIPSVSLRRQVECCDFYRFIWDGEFTSKNQY